MDHLDEKLIERYLAGSCSEEEMEQILEWLNVSEANRREWMAFRMLPAKEGFARFSGEGHVSRSYREVLSGYLSRRTLEKEITRKVTLRLMRYAASILLLAGMSLGTYRYVSGRLHPEMLTVAVGWDEPVRQVTLDDSTRVWLSANSRMEYPKRFAGKQRTVSLEGKAFFEVTRDAAHPFLVKTDAYTVEVLGTSFEVLASGDGRISEVVLVDGSVEILDSRRAPLCVLQPGQQFALDRRSRQFTVKEVGIARYVDWREGKFEFDGMTLAEIIRALERHYNVQLVIGEGVDLQQRLVGSLNLERDVDEMMRIIGTVIPVKCTVQNKTVVYMDSSK
ncbi:MAG: FecR domain-containing protein [Bacteroidales bacterium]|jgi:ferric-dicitrate binding protein FerR (iron transport regulator)|nr:FecR domain-containing protein [Bacteroidales bacterium]